MAANVETMFSVREKPWHGLGVVVEDAPSSKDALNLARLDWRVVQKPLFTNSGLVEGYKANVRDSDNHFPQMQNNRLLPYFAQKQF